MTGTKLKCEVIRDYYSFWWGITSGGPSRDYEFNTAIVELNAATGEVYIEDSKETVLGSSGHSINLKTNNLPETRNLKIVLVEDDPDCYFHLKNVITRRWPSIPLNEAEGPPSRNSSNIYLLNKKLADVLTGIDELDLGNTLYFFDPLRSISYSTIEHVASHRMPTFLKTGIEFIVFVFTSDWFAGRRKFAPLPETENENVWSPEQLQTVKEADDLFGSTDWRNLVLNISSTEEKEKTLIELYRYKLHKWFRYVLPMPFKPKPSQLFHLILCSNYEAGVRATKDFYCSKTGNPKYSPDNGSALKLFRRLHPELWESIAGNERPLQWKMLWAIIRNHEEGICDAYCRDFREMHVPLWKRRESLDWLEKKGYIEKFRIEYPWSSLTPLYQRFILNWTILRERLRISPPLPLIPLPPGET